MVKPQMTRPRIALLVGVGLLSGLLGGLIGQRVGPRGRPLNEIEHLKAFEPEVDLCLRLLEDQDSGNSESRAIRREYALSRLQAYAQKVERLNWKAWTNRPPFDGRLDAEVKAYFAMHPAREDDAAGSRRADSPAVWLKEFGSEVPTMCISNCTPRQLTLTGYAYSFCPARE